MNRREALRRTGFAVGATALTPALLSLFQSCRSEPRRDWKPSFFTEEEAVLVSAFVDILLPRTETPGGLDVKVDMFLDRVVSATYDEAGQQELREELAAMDTRAREQQGDAFAALRPEERAAFLREEEAVGGKFNAGVWGTAVGEQAPVSFYRRLKSVVIWGYLSSEQIGTEVLRYDPIPGEYVGCLPLAEGQRSWSL